MRTINYLTRTTGVASAILLGAGLSARASVDMSLVNLGLSTTTVGVSETALGANNFSDAAGSVYIGMYQFQISSSDTPSQLAGTPFSAGQTLYSVCLSPGGVLDNGTYSYNYDTFAQAAPGLNPLNPNFAEGIQNAMFLWQHFNGGVTTGAEGAGLAEAMYAAYYNYNSPGAITGGFNGGFSPLWGSSGSGAGTPQYYYDQDLAYLQSSGPTGIGAGYTGYLLVPTSPGAGEPSGQEFIVFASNSPNTPVVPEPTTIIAGMSLLLPLGVGTLKGLRKNKANA